MSESRIVNKKLWDSLGTIKDKGPWLKAAEKLGLKITRPSSGSSHCSIRNPDPKIPLHDVRGLIATVYDGMSRQVNGKVFKRFLDYGIKEDDLWRALEMLK